MWMTCDSGLAGIIVACSMAQLNIGVSDNLRELLDR